MAGRPLKFNTPEELEKLVQEYFDETDPEEWILTRLIFHVGLGKTQFFEYGKREGYSHIIDEARLLIESSYELDLKKYGRTGTIFALKANYGWKETQFINHTVDADLVIDDGFDRALGNVDDFVDPASLETDTDV